MRREVRFWLRASDPRAIPRQPRRERALRKFVALLDGVSRRVDRLSESHRNFSRLDDQRVFLHDAMRAGAGHRHDRNSRLDGHDEGTLFEPLQAAIRAARSLGIDQERKSFAHIFDGLLDAGERGVAILAVHGNEFRQTKRQADDGNIEQRFPAQEWRGAAESRPRSPAHPRCWCDSRQTCKRPAGIFSRPSTVTRISGNARDDRPAIFTPVQYISVGRLGDQRKQNERRPQHQSAERSWNTATKAVRIISGSRSCRAGCRLGCAAAFPWRDGNFRDLISRVGLPAERKRKFHSSPPRRIFTVTRSSGW